MPKRSNSIQKLVHLIERQLSGKAVVRQSVEIPDRSSGEMREVDVVIDVESGHHALRIGVEVISGRGSTPWVESMIGKHLSGHLTDKLILVAGAGFSAPARTKAAAFSVETLTLSEATAVDWAAAVFAKESLWFARLDLSPQEITLTVQASSGGDSLVTIGPETVVLSADGNRKATLLQLVRQFVKAKRPLRDTCAREDREKLARFEMDGTPDEECFVLDEAGERRRVSRLHVTGAVRFAMAEVKMQKTSYGGAAVAYGESEIGGQKLLVAGVEERDGEPAWSVNLAESDNDPGLLVDLTAP